HERAHLAYFVLVFILTLLVLADHNRDHASLVAKRVQIGDQAGHAARCAHVLELHAPEPLRLLTLVLYENTLEHQPVFVFTFGDGPGETDGLTPAVLRRADGGVGYFGLVLALREQRERRRTLLVVNIEAGVECVRLIHRDYSGWAQYWAMVE